MVFQPVPNAAGIVVVGSCQNVPMTNTFYATKATPYGEADLLAVADAVDNWWSTQMLPKLSITYNYLRTEVTGLASINDLQVIDGSGAGLGGNAGAPLPNNCAAAISRRSIYTGRSSRGRVFIGGLPISTLSSNENIFQTTLIDDIITVLNALKTILAAIGWIEAIVSRYSGGVKRAEGLTFVVAEYAAVDYRVDSQRARMI